jgi:hypothetical protein
MGMSLDSTYKVDGLKWFFFLRLAHLPWDIRNLGGFTPSYILHTRAFGTYLLRGLFTLHKRL